MMESEPITRVQQEEPHGCAIASIAMIAGMTYQDVRALVEYPFAGKGLSNFTYDGLLADLGYALARKYPFKHYDGTMRNPWPCKPFGDVHICEVRYEGAKWGHVVVMSKDGTVLDPLAPDLRSLSDYAEVTSIAAVVRLYSH